mmetsp:Transcript_35614/g.113883  ORF Transcript_35614/g.113883 Transcript_35614/m.113883 type:complete len:240 (-) Transcript_35614:118-837(-)
MRRQATHSPGGVSSDGSWAASDAAGAELEAEADGASAVPRREVGAGRSLRVVEGDAVGEVISVEQDGVAVVEDDGLRGSLTFVAVRSAEVVVQRTPGAEVDVDEPIRPVAFLATSDLVDVEAEFLGRAVEDVGGYLVLVLQEVPRKGVGTVDAAGAPPSCFVEDSKKLAPCRKAEVAEPPQRRRVPDVDPDRSAPPTPYLVPRAVRPRDRPGEGFAILSEEPPQHHHAVVHVLHLTPGR